MCIYAFIITTTTIIIVLVVIMNIIVAIIISIITLIFNFIINGCLMILQVDLADSVAGGHCYKDKAGQEGAAPRSRQARVGKELAGMAADLPLNVSSSVFLRVDEKQMMLWKALITGTQLSK